MQTQLSCHMWFCGCCCRTVCGVAGTIVGLCYVMVAVAMPHAVSWSLLLCCVELSSWLCHVWCPGHGHRAVCCGCCHCTVRGVVGAVVRLHYVVVTVTMPCVVSRSLLSCRVVLSLWSCHMWHCGHSRRAMVLRSWWLSSCRWCRSCSHCCSGIVVTIGGCTMAGPGGGGQPHICRQGWW